MARVLIVDDDEMDRLFNRRVLEKSGHELFFAKNGEEAYRLYLRMGIQVVVTDLAMPHVDGIELIRELKALFPDAAIVAVSGKGKEKLAMAKFVGAQAILTKPVDARALVEAVAKAVASLPADD
ncbi:MAG TPA: response regulator [Longimicrobiales bacterium]|jgi:CheY-like chemotaxis protein